MPMLTEEGRTALAVVWQRYDDETDLLLKTTQHAGGCC